MNKSKVTLIHYTPLEILQIPIRTCWASEGKSDTGKYICFDCNTQLDDDIVLEQQGAEKLHCPECQSENVWYDSSCGEKDKALIHRVGNQYKHSSQLEFASFIFKIDGVSRALLQEIARHRIGTSFGVKSSRYTLKELKKEKPFIEDDGNFIHYDFDRAKEFIVLTDNVDVNKNSIEALDRLREIIFNGVGNDKAKYCMPESYRTNLTFGINLRSLQNLVFLRSDKSALLEFRMLVDKIIEAMPEEYRYLIDEFHKGKKDV